MNKKTNREEVRTKRVCVAMSPEERKKLALLAKKDNRSSSSYLRKLLVDAFEKEGDLS